LRPDWWKLEPFQSTDDWTPIVDAIWKGDPYCRGVLVLGLTSNELDLARAFDSTAGLTTIRGFAVGRTILGATAERWLSDELSDADALIEMTQRFKMMIERWRVTRVRSADPLAPDQSKLDVTES
jgi:5-dehydro-2-deoxygluconokinase